jgi:hypothetical protein
MMEELRNRLGSDVVLNPISQSRSLAEAPGNGTHHLSAQPQE